MNHHLLILLVVASFFISCEENESSSKPLQITTENVVLNIPDTIVEKSKLKYDSKISRWTYNNRFYSGYAVRMYQDSTLAEKFGILDGKKQNQSIHFYTDGLYKHLANYHLGKLHGPKKSWSVDSSHILISHLNYNFGKAHGQQTKWYPTGEIFQKLNFNMGKEEGLQKAFRKNGDLYANYEAREGRIFGLKKAALCFGIENENMKYED